MQSKTVITYTYLPDHDIHEFTFDKATRQGMDEYIEFIYEIYDEHLKGKDTALFILDIHKSGMLPVKYASMIMEKTFKDLAPFPKVFAAYLSDEMSDKSLISIMDYTASRQVNRLQFNVDQRDEAIQWLLERRDTPVY